ncbi:MAG: STAS domain-containing protein [Spirochaetes bacterium]|nr:STAS domain-containing protein [Spirochaetota bacterium]
MKFNIETIVPGGGRKDSNIIVKIDLKGSLDNNITPEFDYILNTLITGGVKKIILDIDGLQYLDSTGIGSIIGITKKIRKENGDIAITRYTSQILTIVRPINMEKFVQFFSTVDEGIAYLRSVEAG